MRILHAQELAPTDKVLSGIQTPAIILQSHFRHLRLCKHLCICFINLTLKAVHCLDQLELCGLCATRRNCNIMFTKILYPTAPKFRFSWVLHQGSLSFLRASGKPCSCEHRTSGFWPLLSSLPPASSLWSLASSSPLEKTEPWASGWSHTL